MLEIALSPYVIFQGLLLTTLADGRAQERELVEVDLLPTAAYIPSSLGPLLVRFRASCFMVSLRET